MSHECEPRIDIEAAKALIHWKSMFADEVATQAKQLAAELGHRVALPSCSTEKQHWWLFARFRWRSPTEGRAVATRKPLKSEPGESQQPISAAANDWIRQSNPKRH